MTTDALLLLLLYMSNRKRYRRVTHRTRVNAKEKKSWKALRLRTRLRLRSMCTINEEEERPSNTCLVGVICPFSFLAVVSTAITINVIWAFSEPGIQFKVIALLPESLTHKVCVVGGENTEKERREDDGNNRNC
eukprot:TRINITY_DN203_c0_g2_i3.p2 TRINITY_DN203_c0_g2~~TRINITY_DN203_c0_g2_i3.p2  ORF type:complete len:134 (+),score=22.23 TRINITY_DN203_c0_g2_i3:419-820(+)